MISFTTLSRKILIKLPKVKEGAVIRDGFTVTNVESWQSGKGDGRKQTF